MCDNLNLAWCKNWKHKACLVPEVMRSLWLTGRFKTLAVTGTSPPTYHFRLPVILVQPAFHLFHKKQAKITSHPVSGFSSTEQAAHMGNISNIWVEWKKERLNLYSAALRLSTDSWTQSCVILVHCQLDVAILLACNYIVSVCETFWCGQKSSFSCLSLAQF